MSAYTNSSNDSTNRLDASTQDLLTGCQVRRKRRSIAMKLSECQDKWDEVCEILIAKGKN